MDRRTEGQQLTIIRPSTISIKFYFIFPCFNNKFKVFTDLQISLTPSNLALHIGNLYPLNIHKKINYFSHIYNMNFITVQPLYVIHLHIKSFLLILMFFFTSYSFSTAANTDTHLHRFSLHSHDLACKWKRFSHTEYFCFHCQICLQ